MNEWKYSLDFTSKEDWLHRIRKDLRETPVESFDSEWWDGEALTPFIHSEDHPGDKIQLPDHLFRQPPRLIEWIATVNRSAVEINRDVLNALQYGAEEIVFEIKDDPGKDVNEWLQNVQQEIIALGFFSENIGPDIPLPFPVRRIRNSQRSVSPDSMVSNSIQVMYMMETNGNFVNHCALVFSDLMDDISSLDDAGKSKYLRTCKIVVNPGHDFTRNIIQLRVIQLLRLNILALLSKNDERDFLQVECHVTQDTGLDPNQYLLKASLNALGAGLCGVHALCIKPPKDSAGFYNRIIRNIHHLLNYESELYAGTDPIGGSYFIDFYTKRWTEMVWDQLKEKRKAGGWM
jgi:hypothetical protein